VTTVLPDAIGCLIGASVVAVPMLLSKGRWKAEAHKLARRYDLALPEAIEKRVARWLRARYALTMPVIVAVMLLTGHALSRLVEPGSFHESTLGFMTLLVLVPVTLIVFSLILALPRWNRVRERRVAHFTQTRLEDVFTRREWTFLGLGAVLTAFSSGWALHAVGAAAWWCLWVVPVAIGAVAWKWSTGLIVSRRSSANDALELAWDDLLRVHLAREITVGAAWIPWSYIAAIDLLLHNRAHPNLLLGVLPLAIGLAVIAAGFRQGRNLWRNAWATPQPAS
jgi:hypothetical protein